MGGEADGARPVPTRVRIPTHPDARVLVYACTAVPRENIARILLLLLCPTLLPQPSSQPRRVAHVAAVSNIVAVVFAGRTGPRAGLTMGH